MGLSKAFKITKEPRIFQAGESTGFQLSLGSQYYDRTTKQKQWANYKAVVFAKGNQLSFYQQALVVGTVVELSADELKIDNYNPEYLSIELVDARVGGIFTQQSTGQNQASAQQSQQQSAWGQPQQPSEPTQDFDEIIPF